MKKTEIWVSGGVESSPAWIRVGALYWTGGLPRMIVQPSSKMHVLCLGSQSFIRSKPASSKPDVYYLVIVVLLKKIILVI